MAVITNKKKQPPKIEVWRMFDRIARRYDLLNHLLSLGQDIRWRKKVGRFLTPEEGQYVLDLATGTGDQLLYLLKCSKKIAKAVGIDLAKQMLAVGRTKIHKRNLDDRIKLIEGDAQEIPYEDDVFDAATFTFGIRNVSDVERSISEIFRVLKPKGRVLILEFSLPENKIIRKFYFFYFRNILPVLGAIISGDRYAYRYLNQSVETFPYGNDFCELLRTGGFKQVSMQPLTFGIATIYWGDKPDGEFL